MKTIKLIIIALLVWLLADLASDLYMQWTDVAHGPAVVNWDEFNHAHQ